MKALVKMQPGAGNWEIIDKPEPEINDDQVKIRGYRIELGEVEAALGRCRGVSQAIVRMGRIGEYAALEAFLLPQGGARLDLAGIRAELAALLTAEGPSPHPALILYGPLAQSD